MNRRIFLAAAGAVGLTPFLPEWATAERHRRRAAATTTTTTPYRAFTADSYWNAPIPAGAPLDASNAAYIADAKAHSGPGMLLTLGSFAQPFYWAVDTDPLQTITAGGKSVTIHVPANADAMNSSDGELTIFDLSLNVVAGFHQASRTSTGQIVCNGLDRWHLNSNGLSGALPESNDKYNTGHRGSPAPLRGIRLDEVQAGLIPHKVAGFWWATGPGHYFPMSGDEGDKGGIVPEGMLCRINPALDLTTYFPAGSANHVITKCFQDYGVYVGDNSGSGSRVKLEQVSGSQWAQLGVTTKSLSVVPWDQWQFIQRGYGA